MNNIIRVFKNSRKWFCIILLFIMGWQQWATFLKYQEKFLSPIKYVKDSYGKNDITQYENRFGEIKKMFPKPTRITYVSEGWVPNAGTREYHFALTQYYLAPNLFFRTNIMHDTLSFDSGSAGVTSSSVVYDTVLFNLYSSLHINPANNFFINNGWHMLKDFNNGLVLLVK